MTASCVPEFVPADAHFEWRTRESFGRQGAMALLGASLATVRPGFVEIELAYRPELSQQHGFFHAGIVSTVADGERIVAAGTVIRPGRTITVARFDVHVEKAGRRTHCATGLQTIMCIVGRAGVKG